MDECQDSEHCNLTNVPMELCKAYREGCQKLTEERFKSLKHVVIACSSTLGIILTAAQLIITYLHW
ncbi:hypothetical protein MUP38_01370 [Candidatus Bathyarchaeota archaeon]|nr:hypothetical protein [Candidatus Bathyarchaeota archaeon]